MDTFRKGLLVVGSTAAVVLLLIWSQDAFGFRSPVFALLCNWLAMSWVAVIGQVVPLLLPGGYYRIRAFERTGAIYEAVGVHLFKRLVRRGPLTIFSPTLRFPQEKTVAALRQLDQEMRKAEAGHMVIFVVMLLFMSYALLWGWWDAAGWMLLFNVLINGYPVMLQRYNRIKLGQLIERRALGSA